MACHRILYCRSSRSTCELGLSPMGVDDSAPMDEKVGRAHHPFIVVLASAIFLGCIYSPPHLMDDVDAVQAQISRNMLESGDWVTARLNGVAYLEKSPLGYWLSATSFRIFGVHDWAARLPLSLAVIALCFETFRFGSWA